MTLRVGNITVDCTDTMRVARFWAAALGRPLDAASGPGFASIGTADPDRTEPAWLFETVPEGKVAKNRLHLDFIDPDHSAVGRLVALGAVVLAEHQLGEGGHSWTVMADPEGNEFCVARGTYTG